MRFTSFTEYQAHKRCVEKHLLASHRPSSNQSADPHSTHVTRTPDTHINRLIHLTYTKLNTSYTSTCYAPSSAAMIVAKRASKVMNLLMKTRVIVGFGMVGCCAGWSCVVVDQDLDSFPPETLQICGRKCRS